MRALLFMLACAAAMVAGMSCAKDKASGDLFKSAALAGGSGKAATNQPRAAGDSDAPAYPKNARYTILCREIRGEGHVERARALKESLIKQTKLKDWHLLHQEDSSLLLYGFYETFDDPSNPKERDRAQRDRAAIDGLTDAAGNRPFSQAIFWPLSAPDPVAPREWNLVNAPADAYYTLEIGVYKDSPMRKQAAVEAVKEARSKGIEAYYYHGETASSVCIGAWPRGAVRTQGAEATTPDSDQPLLVLPPGMAPPPGKEMRGPDGRVLKTIVPSMKPLDPTLIDAMKKYPYHAINGQVTGVKNKESHAVVPDPSVVMVIPRKAPSLLDGSPTAPQAADGLTRGGADEAPVESAAPPPPPQRSTTPGVGRLKSIGS